ncbi:MAG TPA: organoarsenical effux MFS transporter ArsJ [Planctomycetota bacterium]|nr:organoarsenical effux MFS transporter ArsJ [Planctomycetota bacterium]
MRNVRDYAIITACYWAFTLTDGALRMLVLLYLNGRGYSPLEIASLFLFYEFFGVVTNFVGGWVGARFGLRSTLFAGLSIQILACLMLTAREALLTVPYVMVAQALCGIAKDLTKMSSKSYIRLVVPEGDHAGLMRWVAILTGSKNALKGAGFFLGGLLLGLLGFKGGCGGMAAGLFVTLAAALLLLPPSAGKTSAKLPFKSVFSDDPRINWLSAARFFLFGARDIWFVLALPVFLQSGLGWSFSGVGAFLALWIVGYGVVQTSAPLYLRRISPSGPPTARALGWWTLALVLPLGATLAALRLSAPPAPALVLGLAAFGLVFATDSAVHSYLVVAYAGREKVALAVGFYYMANAGGRLIGTLLSGAVFQAAGMGENGLAACIAGSLGFVLLSRAACGPLGTAERRAHALPLAGPSGGQG